MGKAVWLIIHCLNGGCGPNVYQCLLNETNLGVAIKDDIDLTILIADMQEFEKVLLAVITRPIIDNNALQFWEQFASKAQR